MIHQCFNHFDAGSAVAEDESINNFLVVNSTICTCEGYRLVYECTVDRDSGMMYVYTVWTGTAFDCPATNNEINFLSGIPNEDNLSCNDGAISGHVITADNDSYTSQLSILVTPEVIGSNISCFIDGTTGTILIGSTTLTLSTGIVTSQY